MKINELTEERKNVIREFPYIISSKNGESILYKVLNIDTKTIFPLPGCNVSTLENDLKSNIELFSKMVRDMEDVKQNCFTNTSSFWEEQFFKNPNHLFNFGTPTVSTTNPEEWNYNFIDKTLIKQGNISAYNEFLSRCDYPEYLKCFYGSLFDPTNKALRFCLWLKGHSGLDGKSIMAKMISSSYYGSRDIASLGIINSNSFGDQKRWLNHKLEAKPLVIYPDNQHHLNLIQNEMIHSWLGGDPVTVEPKFGTPRDADGYKKLIVCSNYSPSINTQARNETSRVIIIKVAPIEKENRTKNWENDLWNQRYAFMYECIRTYEKMVSKRSGELIDDVPQEMYAECSSEEEYLLDSFFNHFDFSPKSFMKADDFNSAFRSFCVMKHVKQEVGYKKRLANFLEKNNVKIGTAKKIGDKTFRVHQGISLKKDSIVFREFSTRFEEVKETKKEIDEELTVDEAKTAEELKKLHPEFNYEEPETNKGI